LHAAFDRTAYAACVRIALVLLACCHQAPPPERAAPPASCPWQLLHAQKQCGDLRGGLSGFWILEVVDGPHAQQRVLAFYGEAHDGGRVDNWNLSRTVTFRPTPEPSGGWPNECTQAKLGGETTYAGAVDTVESFGREADARAALAKRCP
jgi:hypothetical protein